MRKVKWRFCINVIIRFHAILGDNGIMRLNECQTVKRKLIDQLGINLKVVDSTEIFLNRLIGVTDPEKKCKIIGNTFIEIFESEASKLIRKQVMV